MKFKQRSEEQPPLPQSLDEYGTTKQKALNKKIKKLKAILETYKHFINTSADQKKVQNDIERVKNELKDLEQQLDKIVKNSKKADGPPVCKKCGGRHWWTETCDESAYP